MVASSLLLSQGTYMAHSPECRLTNACGRLAWATRRTMRVSGSLKGALPPYSSDAAVLCNTCLHRPSLLCSVSSHQITELINFGLRTECGFLVDSTIDICHLQRSRFVCAGGGGITLVQAYGQFLFRSTPAHQVLQLGIDSVLQ